MEPITLQKLFNPTSEDLTFSYNSAPYTVKAGQTETFVAHIALHGAKKLADREAMTSDPDEQKVLMRAYMENSDPEVVAKSLGINLSKIRAEAMTKEKEKARMVNLESIVNEQNKKIEMLIRLSETKAKPVVAEEEAKKVDKRTKAFKESNQITQ